MASMTYIREHNENIYDFFPPSIATPKRQPRYVSMYHSQAAEEAKAKKRTCVVLDLAGTPLTSPANYLKKHTRSAKLHQEHKPTYKHEGRFHEHRKPPLPNFENLLSAVKVCGKKINFLKENIDAVSKLPPSPTNFYCIDTPYGDRRLYNHSGLQLKYALKKNYGKLPNYLVKDKKRNEEFQLEMTKRQEEETQVKQRRIRILSDEQRLKILRGLKDNWIQSNSEYLALPLVLDIPGNIQKKRMLEYHLSAIERDIKLLQYYDTIYVLKPKHYHNENEERNLPIQEKIARAHRDDPDI